MAITSPSVSSLSSPPTNIYAESERAMRMDASNLKMVRKHTFIVIVPRPCRPQVELPLVYLVDLFDYTVPTLSATLSRR